MKCLTFRERLEKALGWSKAPFGQRMCKSVKANKYKSKNVKGTKVEDQEKHDMFYFFVLFVYSHKS